MSPQGAWRTRNRAGREFSWFSNKGNGLLMDHALCTSAMDQTVNSVCYLQGSITTGLTDHACLVLDLVN